MRKKFIVDRFEGDFAVLTDDAKKSVSVKKTALPDDVFPGATLFLENRGYVLDQADTVQRQQRIAQKTSRIFEE